MNFTNQFNFFRVLGLGWAVSYMLFCNAWGQSDSWNADASGNWSVTSNWVGGTSPGAGGVATFGDSFGLSLNRTVTNDANPTLSGLTFDTNFIYFVGASANQGTIDLNAATPFTLNVIRSNGISPNLFGVGHIVNSTLQGSATSFNKTGNGIVTLSGTNTFTATAGVNLLGGELRVTSGDAAFGDVSNSLNLDGGKLRVSTTAVTSARSMNIGSGGATFNPFANITLNGTITGTGQLNVRSAGGGLTIGGDASGFTGAIQHQIGALTLNSNGVLGGTGLLDVAGSLAINNSAVSISDRINNARAVTMRGAHIIFTGNAAGTTETLGNLVLANGGSSVTVTSNTIDSTLRFSGLTRNLRSTAFFRGTNLGGSAVPTSQLEFASSPGTLVGGGGALTSTDISILPYAVGSRSSTATAADFVTWDSATQRIYVLDAANYTTLAAATTTSNVNVTATETVAVGGQTVNSLRAGAAVNGAAGDVLTITSGAIIGAGFTVGSDVSFGAAEGVVHAHGSITLSGQVAGTNGLTKSGGQILTLSNASNSYTGTTTINAGRMRVSSDGALGTDTSAIVINSNSVLASSGIGDFVSRFSVFGGPVTINRDFVVNTSGASGAIIGAQTATDFLTLNGNVQVNALTDSPSSSFLTLEGFVAANSVVINGNISGNGGIRDSNTIGAQYILNGNNSYSGGTNLFSGAFSLGHDNAFGTGTVYSSGSGGATPTLPSISSAGGSRTLANNFELIGGGLVVGGADPMTLNGTVFLNGSQSVLAVTATGPGATINGNVFGGSVLKAGTGNLTLTNIANAYTGSTTIRTGTLTLAGNAGYGAGVLGTNPNTTFGSSGTVVLGETSTAAADNISLVTNGAFTIARSIQVNGQNSTGLTTIGGTNTGGTSNFNGQISLNRSSTQLTAANGGRVAFNGQITEQVSAGIVKVGAGTVALSGTNSYTGTTAVNQGRLIVNGTHNLGGAYTVGADAALGGTGLIANSDVTVQANGILSPGDELGTLRLGQDLNLNGVYDWQIASPLLADLVTVGGNLAISGKLTLNFLANIDLEKFNKFTLFAYSGNLTGNFGTSLDGWSINYSDKTPGVNLAPAGSWTYVTLTPTGGRSMFFAGTVGHKLGNLSAVPEPSSVGLVCLALLVLTGKRSRSHG
jgi:autotransporter-associated beta strand protein